MAGADVIDGNSKEMTVGLNKNSGHGAGVVSQGANTEDITSAAAVLSLSDNGNNTANNNNSSNNKRTGNNKNTGSNNVPNDNHNKTNTDHNNNNRSNNDNSGAHHKKEHHHYHYHKASTSHGRNSSASNIINSHLPHHSNNRTSHTVQKSRHGRQRKNTMSKSVAKVHEARARTTLDEADLRAADISILPPISAGLRNDLVSPRNPGQVSGQHSHAMSKLPSTPDGCHSYQNGHLDPNLKSVTLPAHNLTNKAGNSTNRGANSSLSNNQRLCVTSNSDYKTSNSPEPARLSPVNATDKPKTKFEKKVLTTLAENNVLQRDPSPGPVRSAGQAQGATSPVPQSRENKLKSRRSSHQSHQSQSLPKISTPEEPFSIRRKIEQFRKWHEEQYTDKLKRLRVDDTSKNEPNEKRSNQISPPSQIDFAKMLEDNIGSKDTNNVPDAKATGVRETPRSLKGDRPTRKSAEQPRPTSGATWKTWRDVNQSDAYNDVKKYIKDNDLMDAEREKWIKTWITDVQTAMDQQLIEVNN